jgi:hypothetical protein
MDSKQFIIQLGKKYGFDSSEDVFQVHGKWVVTKTGIQKIVDQEFFTYAFQVIEASSDYCAVLCDIGDKDNNRISCSLGSAEACNVKNKQRYYLEMAEKRAKARAVLMAIGAHGRVYSEDEADEFKPAK